MLLSRTFRILGEANINSEQLPLQSNSKVEKMICDPSFAYTRPWFYNHPYALRCELGIGDTNRVYMKNAYSRALKIFNVLFPNKPDAMMFDYWVEDYSCYDKFYIKNILRAEKETYHFLSKHYQMYRYRVVQNIPLEDDEEFVVKRNRIICYSSKNSFDYKCRIKEQILGKGHTVSYISFENECVFSVYDDRGCDIVFATKEKMKEFFEKLKPYLLEYDMENMLQRISD